MERGTCWATVFGITKIWTWLKTEKQYWYIMLWTILQTLSGFFSFPINVLFLFQDPIQDITLQIVLVSSGLWCFSVFACFSWAWQLRGLLFGHFVKCLFTWVSLMVSSQLDWVWMPLGKSTTEVKHPSHHITSHQGCMMPWWLFTGPVNLDCLVKVVSAGFSTACLLCFLFQTF